MNANKMASLIRSTAGRFFRVEFLKRTAPGELRKMVARIGVQKNLTGGGLKFNPRKRDLMVVFDIQRNGYRMVNLRGVKSFRCGKRNWSAA